MSEEVPQDATTFDKSWSIYHEDAEGRKWKLIELDVRGKMVYEKWALITPERAEPKVCLVISEDHFGEGTVQCDAKDHHASGSKEGI